MRPNYLSIFSLVEFLNFSKIYFSRELRPSCVDVQIKKKSLI